MTSWRVAVLLLCRFTQVGRAVVERIVVDVVNHLWLWVLSFIGEAPADVVRQAGTYKVFKFSVM